MWRHSNASSRIDYLRQVLDSARAAKALNPCSGASKHLRRDERASAGVADDCAGHPLERLSDTHDPARVRSGGDQRGRQRDPGGGAVCYLDKPLTPEKLTARAKNEKHHAAALRAMFDALHSLAEAQAEAEALAALPRLRKTFGVA